MEAYRVQYTYHLEYHLEAGPLEVSHLESY